MDSALWVENFLKYCDSKDIKPWEFDFKNFYKDDHDDSNNSLELWLKYKSCVIDKPIDNPTNLSEVFSFIKEQESDPDKVAFPIYKVLNFQNKPTDSIRGDSMNSFKTSFTRSIMYSKNKKEVYKKIEIDNNKYLDDQYNILLKNENYQQFQLINDNLKEIKKFACLTHAIGNFVTINFKTNMERGKSKAIGDYFDLTLQAMRNEIFSQSNSEEDGIANWKAYIKKYYLQPYVHNNQTYTVAELWKDHFEKSVYPKEDKDFEQFYRNANLLIEVRGQFLTKKLCDILELQNLGFYEELKDIENIKFFDEITSEKY